MKSVSKLVNVCVLFAMAIFINGCEENGGAILAVKTISEYGTYFGMKKAKLPEEKAKIVEEALRVAIQLIKEDGVDGFVDVDKAMEKVPEQIKPYIEEAIDVVNSKYIKLKGKISTSQAAYLNAILSGAFEATERYRATFGPTVQDAYAITLEKKYQEAKKKIK